MFKFFTERRWYGWSIFGSIFILVSTWYQVQLDVKINEWFGEFYDTDLFSSISFIFIVSVFNFKFSSFL